MSKSGEAFEKLTYEEIRSMTLKEVGEWLDEVAWKTLPFAGIGNVNITALEELIEALKRGEMPE